MDIKKAADYFELGLIKGLLVRAPSVLHDGWTIEMSGNIGNASPTLHTTRGDVREFKTLAAAASAARQIGFRQWSVITD